VPAPAAAHLTDTQARAAELLAAVLEDVRSACALAAGGASPPPESEAPAGSTSGGAHPNMPGGMRGPADPAPISPTTRRPQRPAHAIAASLGIELRAAEACLAILADSGRVVLERRPLIVAGVLVRAALFAEPVGKQSLQPRPAKTTLVPPIAAGPPLRHRSQVACAVSGPLPPAPPSPEGPAPEAPAIRQAAGR
jgi:hypothetical protein